jgi:hypothetical protein
MTHAHSDGRICIRNGTQDDSEDSFVSFRTGFRTYDRHTTVRVRPWLGGNGLRHARWLLEEQADGSSSFFSSDGNANAHASCFSMAVQSSSNVYPICAAAGPVTIASKSKVAACRVGARFEPPKMATWRYTTVDLE